VARRDDRERVAAIGGTHRAYGRRMTYLARDLTLASRLAERNRQQGRPNESLEFRAFDVEWNVEDLEISLKVRGQLSRCFHKCRVSGSFGHRSEAYAAQIVVLP
jgi:hypothetical protein